ARAVLEDEADLEARFADQLARLRERRLTLAAEADDEVAAHRHARHALAAARQHLAVEADRVEALHAPEHLVAAGLRRDVQVLAHLRQLAQRVEQVVGHVAREVRDELDALQPRRVVNARKQIAEALDSAVAVRVAVAVDGLAEQRDLLAAL